MSKGQKLTSKGLQAILFHSDWLVLLVPIFVSLDLENTSIETFYCNHNYGFLIQKLNLSNTWISYIPDSICNFKELVSLSLSGCIKIKRLPETVQFLTKLKFLNLSYCTHFERLPNCILSLTEIEHIDLQQTKCYIDYLPNKFTEKISFSYISSNQEIDY